MCALPWKRRAVAGGGRAGEAVVARAVRTHGTSLLAATLNGSAHSPELRLELTCDDEPLVYCVECWEREFGDDPAERSTG